MNPMQVVVSRFARILCAAGVVAALGLGPAGARAQDLPQGWTDDTPDAAGETGASQAPVAQPAQDLAGDEYADTDPSALTEFQQPLSGYGTWVDDPTYGTVWVPAAEVVGPDFAPYVTAGHWAMTDEGEWLWVSDYEWGYVPFHYGRWTWTAAYGWVWIPGRVYAPAWVVWRTGDYGYIGWAPMPPTYYWSGGFAVSFGVVPAAAYIFCPTTYVFHRHVHTYIVRDRTVVHRVAAHTRPYRPAAGRPSAGPPSRQGATPGRSQGYRPASPSLSDARIAPSSTPRERVRADARALAYAHRSTTPQARAMPLPSRSRQGAQVPEQRDLRDPFGRLPQRDPRVQPRPQGEVRDPFRGPQRMPQPGAVPGRPDVAPAPGPQRVPRPGPGDADLKNPFPRPPAASGGPVRVPRAPAPPAPVLRTPGAQRPHTAVPAPMPRSSPPPRFEAPRAAPAPAPAPKATHRSTTKASPVKRK